MKLSDLLATLGPEQLRTEVLTRDGVAVVKDAVIYDPPHTLGPGQMVLAVGIEANSSTAAGILVGLC